MRPLEPAILTIFGISGDLARRKLLPSLYDLAHKKLLSGPLKIVGISLKVTTPNNIINSIKDLVEKDGKKCDPDALAWLEKNIIILHLDIEKDAAYLKLKKELDKIEDKMGLCLNRLFYLAIPSALFGNVIQRLDKYDLAKGCQHQKAESRLLIEKPFGHNLESSKELIKILEKSFAERLIYRIDHYLAKETVQNILTFRFENPIFKTIWNRHHIDHIIITAAEEIGIEGRVAFYEQSGALKDLVQSHLLQLLALATIKEPDYMDASHIHAAKERILSQTHAPALNDMPNNTVRGQYKTYKKEVGKPDSNIETYAAVRLYIENESWKGVPIILRTGKALKEKISDIVIVFKDTQNNEYRNYLTIRIQPNEGIVLSLSVKKPGFEREVEQVQMSFCYNDSFNIAHPDAYEWVLIDAIKGDRTLFATSTEILESWRIIEPILSAWENNHVKMQVYENGSWGPIEAESLIRDIGGSWISEYEKICRLKL